METIEEKQQNELTALQSIYANDYIETQPKAWKGAARLREFIIRVTHPNPDFTNKFSFDLHVIFPKTYPVLAYPTFTIQKPINGLTQEQVSKLTTVIHNEARALKGSEMVMEIVTTCQEWLEANIVPPVEVPGSLALQMNQRAEDEEKARKQKAEADAFLASQQALKEAQEMEERIKLDAQKRGELLASARDKQKLRSGGNLSVPSSPYIYGAGLHDRDTFTPTESFGEEVEFMGVKFSSVKFFHPRDDCLGTTYSADPICDDVNATLPLELHVIRFETPYYSTSQGKKKLRHIETELRKLTKITHPNVLRIIAVKLVGANPTPNHSDAIATLVDVAQPQLFILTEQAPALTLHDVLEDCDNLREEKATDYLIKILQGLNAIHEAQLVHRGIDTRSIGLVSSSPSHRSLGVNGNSPSPVVGGGSASKQLKLFKVGYYTRLLDFHRSNPFHYRDGRDSRDVRGMLGYNYEASLSALSFSLDDSQPQSIPDAWLSKDVKNESSLLYTRHRDIHAAGVVFLQMLLGLDVMQKFGDVHSAIEASTISPSLQRHALNMLIPPKKANISCLSLISEIAESTSQLQYHQQGNSSKGVFIPGSLTRNGRGEGEINGFGNGTGTGQEGHGMRNGNGMETRTPMRSPVITFNDPKTPLAMATAYGSSPEETYFMRSAGMSLHQHQRQHQHLQEPGMRPTSRWKEDWEELELLGKGAFGSVVKARNKVDARIYAVKKVRLRGVREGDAKIFREVNALSRLNHRFIVRYYTTWLEKRDMELESRAASEADSDEEMDDDTTQGTGTGTGTGRSRRLLASSSTDDNIFSCDIPDDLDDPGASRGSFPSIHFARSTDSTRRGVVGHPIGIHGGDGVNTDTDLEDTDPETSSDSDGSLGLVNRSGPDGISIEQLGMLGDALKAKANARSKKTSEDNMFLHAQTPTLERTLYIQMEFVERQTLKERVDEGLTEAEAWRLFQQIVDALVHMNSHQIIHRDIKLTNIFIDGNGDCKVGDFGLATSSLAAVDPSDVSPRVAVMQPDMTLEVGTRLYIAPEVQSRSKKRSKDHSKADMYSLGIVFFEMNYMFSTGSERIIVIEKLRKPEIIFPADWDPNLKNQRQIITWLLQHDPEERPAALELSQSSLLPPRVEDEYFKGALRLMTKPDSQYHQMTLSALFNHPPKLVRSYLYDLEVTLAEHYPLTGIVHERLASIFRLHGAVHAEPTLLVPVITPDDQSPQATFIDRHGDLVGLPTDLLVPFARSAVRQGIQRIKRYHLDNIWRSNAVPGHPSGSKAGIFDIITPDLTHGPVAVAAEMIAVSSDILDSFPNLAQNYEIHISHSNIIDLAMERIPISQRSTVADILQQSKSSASQKRGLLLKKGLLRSMADELEILVDTDEDIDVLLSRLEKTNPSLVGRMRPAVDVMKATVQHASHAGVPRPIIYRPLMLGGHLTHYKDGVLVEVVRKNKRTDVLAAAGRYDNLIQQLAPPKAFKPRMFAYGLQISVEKILANLASFQSSSVKSLVKEARSFGFWSPRRCDVYVVSYQPGYLQDRLEVVSWLWRNNISADLMYESALQEVDEESYVDMCVREGILFTVYPRPRSARRDQVHFKVKSILKGTEYDVGRQELISWLQHEIREQKAVDLNTSGTPASTQGTGTMSQTPIPVTASIPAPPDVQLCLPHDAKKQRKQVKQLFLDRAYELSSSIKTTFQQNGGTGMPVVAIDVSPSLFDALSRNCAWVTDEDAWRSIIGDFSSSGYAHQVREAVAKKKADGVSWLLMVGVREERVGILNLRPP